MKKCVFILPYFGKFKNYFPLFLKSCGSNSDFDWLLITDVQITDPIPPNVQIRRMSFEGLRKRIQSKFDFEISLPYPYKLCDFKPAYGLVFEEWIQEYEWWGYCDCDLILGNLSKFLFPLFEKEYDKLFAVGHMTLYRNTYWNNRRFMKPLHGKDCYRMAFSMPEIRTFDEDYWTETYHDENVHQIFLADHANVFQKDFCFGVSQFRTQFCRAKYAEGTGRFPIQPYEKALYLWESGDLKRITLGIDGQLKEEEFLYIHLQGRKMRYSGTVLAASVFQIYPNGFRRIEKIPTSRIEWEWKARYSPNLQIIRKKWSNLKLRLSKRRRKHGGK